MLGGTGFEERAGRAPHSRSLPFRPLPPPFRRRLSFASCRGSGVHARKSSNLEPETLEATPSPTLRRARRLHHFRSVVSTFASFPRQHIRSRLARRCRRALAFRFGWKTFSAVIGHVPNDGVWSPVILAATFSQAAWQDGTNRRRHRWRRELRSCSRSCPGAARPDEMIPARRGRSSFCCSGVSYDHPAAGIGIAERGENSVPDAKIRMREVRAFHSFGQAEGEAAEWARGHRRAQREAIVRRLPEAQARQSDRQPGTELRPRGRATMFSPVRRGSLRNSSVSRSRCFVLPRPKCSLRCHGAAPQNCKAFRSVPRRAPPIDRLGQIAVTMARAGCCTCHKGERFSASERLAACRRCAALNGRCMPKEITSVVASIQRRNHPAHAVARGESEARPRRVRGDIAPGFPSSSASSLGREPSDSGSVIEFARGARQGIRASSVMRHRAARPASPHPPRKVSRARVMMPMPVEARPQHRRACIVLGRA